MLVGAICAQLAGGRLEPGALRAELGERWWTQAVDAESLERIQRRLREGSREWAGLRPGEALELGWRER